MKRIDSDALGVLNKALGLSGRGSPVTELTDGIVDQALDVAPIVRRGRTLAGNQGIFTAVLRNIHTGATTVSNSIDPYKVPSTGLIAPYPSPMPDLFDVWLLQAAMRRESGSGSINGLLQYQYSAANQGWGVDNTGAAVVGSDPVALAHWDAVATVGTNIFGVLTSADQPLSAARPFRLPRGVDGPLIFTTASSAISTYDCQLTLGVFPVSLGQDGIV